MDVLSDGEFRLDGGAMFGMVPRERWTAFSPPDDRNRIRLGTHGLLVRGPDYLSVARTRLRPPQAGGRLGVHLELRYLYFPWRYLCV